MTSAPQPITRESFGLTMTAHGHYNTEMRIKHSDTADLLMTKADKLYALLNCVTGEPGDAFHRLADELQENILWLASDLAHEVALLVRIATETGEQA